MSTSPAFDAYHRWLGIPAKDQPPHYYRLLGIELYEADPDVIATAADQRMVHLKMFQAGANGALSQRLLNEVAAAQICLLSAEQKAAYDAQLRAKLAGLAPQPPPKPTAVPRAVKPLAKAKPLETAGAFVTDEPAASDFPDGISSAGGPQPRNRKTRNKSKGSSGLVAYGGVALVVGLVGLVAVIWGRADHSQTQLADADRAAAASAKPTEKPDAVATAKSSNRREPTPSASSESDRREDPTHPAPVIAANTIDRDGDSQSDGQGSDAPATEPASLSQDDSALPTPEPMSEKSNEPSGSSWIVLTPTEMSSSFGASLASQPDGSIFVTGPADVGSYTIKAKTNLTGITGVRLEALADARLPSAGPGRGGGNFVLSELTITAKSLADSRKMVPVPLQGAQADFSQPDCPIAAAIDGNLDTGWGIHPNEGKDHAAVFTMKEPVGFAGGTFLTFVLDQRRGGAAFSLGKFRLSVTTSPAPQNAVASRAPANSDLPAAIASDPAPTSEQTPQVWRFRLSKPAAGWTRLDFRDADWNTGPGGFGSDSPTPWTTRDIWLRREFELADLNTVPSVIRIRHDREAEVYINGVLAGRFDGSSAYAPAEVDVPALRAYRQGRNVLAVHCRQGTGPQFIDVGLADQRRPPKFRPFTEVKAVRGKPIDLLKLIDPQRDAVQGRWDLKGGVLTSPSEDWPRIQIPFAPPADYSLTIAGERVAGADLSIGLVIGGAQALLILDGGNPATTGLTSIDGTDLYRSPAINRAHNVLGSGQYTLVCNVRGNEVAIFSNGEPILSWQGAPSQLSLYEKWAVPSQDQLFIAAQNAVHRISAITLVPLSIQASGPKKGSADPIGAELAKARQAYQTAIEKARQKLLAAFEVETKALQADTKAQLQGKRIEQLEAERKAFEADSTKTPESQVMREAANAYRTAVSASKNKCVTAFNKAVKAYQKKQDLENSKQLLDELDDFLHPPY